MAVNKLPTDARMHEVVVKFALKWVRPRLLVRIGSELFVIEVQLLKDILDDIVEPEPVTAEKNPLGGYEIRIVFFLGNRYGRCKLRPFVGAIAIEEPL